MKRTIYALLSAIILATFLSAFHGGSGAFLNAAFSVGLFDEGESGREIWDAVQQYNKMSAVFYNTGGDISGLNEIPAAKLLKRRIFKDINVLKGDGLVMVFDKDLLVLRSIVLKNRTEAEAETREVWAIALQDRKTRRPVFNLKAIDITCRYRMLYQDGLWLVEDVDVYPGEGAS